MEVLATRLISTGWNASGYIFLGSNMMFKAVQSLVLGYVRKKIGHPSQLENCYPVMR